MKENKLIVFLVNANKKIGAGHLKRSISLANKFILTEPKIQIIFTGWSLDKKVTNTLLFHYKKISKKDILLNPKFVDNNSYDKKYLIVDSDDKQLHNIEFQLKCRANGFKTVFFSVNSNYYYDCDFLINPSILAIHQNYSSSRSTKRLFGPKYFIFNRAFESIKPIPRRKFTRSIFINFGNADPKNLSEKIITYISNLQTFEKFEIHLVLGSLTQNKNHLKNVFSHSNLDIRLHIDTKDIKAIMNKCQLAICSPGTTFWELTILGIPSIIIPSSNREIESSKLLSKLEYAECILDFNVTHKPNSSSRSLEYLIQNSNSLIKNFDQLQKLIDTKGIDQIVKVILKK